MQAWAIANQKGGTGKTTTAINLSEALAALGKRVLLVDMDPQGHASLGLGWSGPGRESMAAVLTGDRPLNQIVQTTPGGFHLAPAHLDLAEFEALAERILHPERALDRALENVRGRYDFVFFDCPPRADGVLCANGLRACHQVLLVVETGAFALHGAHQAWRIFTARAAELGRGLVLRVLATLYEPDTQVSRQFLRALHGAFGEAMLETVIKRSARLREAAAYGLPIRRLDAKSAAAADYEALAREFLTEMRRSPAPRVLRPSISAPVP